MRRICEKDCYSTYTHIAYIVYTTLSACLDRCRKIEAHENNLKHKGDTMTCKIDFLYSLQELDFNCNERLKIDVEFHKPYYHIKFDMNDGYKFKVKESAEGFLNNIFPDFRKTYPNLEANKLKNEGSYPKEATGLKNEVMYKEIIKILKATHEQTKAVIEYGIHVKNDFAKVCSHQVKNEIIKIIKNEGGILDVNKISKYCHTQIIEKSQLAKEPNLLESALLISKHYDEFLKNLDKHQKELQDNKVEVQCENFSFAKEMISQAEEEYDLLYYAHFYG